jgi:hypothetical protein
MDWRSALDVTAFSHIWVGGWSFLTVRRWMYRLVELIAALAGLGLIPVAVRAIRKPDKAGERYLIVAVALAGMCAAVAYHSLSTYMDTGNSTANGWYLYAAVAAEAVLLAIGLGGILGISRAAAAMSAVCILALALDLYTVNFVLIPYYTGMVRRGAGSWGGFQEAFRRLALNQPSGIGPAVIAALWVLYLVAAFGLIALAIAQACPRRSREL